MRHRYGPALVVAGALACGCSSGGTGPATDTLPLRTVTDVDLPGTTSRFDYASLDTTRHRLFVSHLGDSQVVVIDTDGPTIERTLDNVARVHGVLAVPALNRLYAAATGSDQAVTYDATTLTELNRAPTGRAPDGLAYDPDNNAVYLSNEARTTVTEIDATTGAARREIDIGGEAGNVAYDPSTKHVLVDVQTRNQFAFIDPAGGDVIERHDLPGCDHDRGLQLDVAHHRAFVACDGNARLLQIDLDTTAVTATFATARAPTCSPSTPAWDASTSSPSPASPPSSTPAPPPFRSLAATYSPTERTPAPSTPTPTRCTSRWQTSPANRYYDYSHPSEPPDDPGTSTTADALGR